MRRAIYNSALGAPSFWRSAHPIEETLSAMHRAAAATAAEFAAFRERGESE